VQRGDGTGHDEVSENPPWCPVVIEAGKGFGAAVAGCGGGTPVTGDGGEGFLKLEGSTEGSEKVNNEDDGGRRGELTEEEKKRQRGLNSDGGSSAPVTRHGHEDEG
jgi:hypothetical protein